ncbi:PAC2 family-domain-containing protein [Tribonema minus]|uniref:Proteasome assembly chaperone 2 n=1 Tax=Tribonema minus TaxID=303371 RepID=A0A836CKN0_9STRA|nr:PAC2 family-domain-containing protein [Tribonema minus]
MARGEPVVSTGNVGQLAADLLIARGLSDGTVVWAASLESEYVLPACGYEKYPAQAKPQLVTALELYIFDKLKLAVVQQRSPVVSPFEDEFAVEVVRWASEQGIEEIVALAGADAIANGEGPTGGVLCYATRAGPNDDNGDDAASATLDTLLAAGARRAHVGGGDGSGTSLLLAAAAAPTAGGALAAEAFALDAADLALDRRRHLHAAGLSGGGGSGGSSGGAGAEGDDGAAPRAALPPLPGGMGICRYLVRAAEEARGGGGGSGAEGVRVVAAAVPCCEGDNTPEAAMLAELVGAALGVLEGGAAAARGGTQWVTPLSWRHLYGAAPTDASMCSTAP